MLTNHSGGRDRKSCCVWSFPAAVDPLEWGRRGEGDEGCSGREEDAEGLEGAVG